MDYQFDIQAAIEEYLTDNGINSKVSVDFDRNDYGTYDMDIRWYEDDDRQGFTVKNCDRYDIETLFDMWVQYREQTHLLYLATA